MAKDSGGNRPQICVLAPWLTFTVTIEKGRSDQDGIYTEAAHRWLQFHTGAPVDATRRSAVFAGRLEVRLATALCGVANGFTFPLVTAYRWAGFEVAKT